MKSRGINKSHRSKESIGARRTDSGDRFSPAESQKPASNKAKLLLRISVFE